MLPAIAIAGLRCGLLAGLAAGLTGQVQAAAAEPAGSAAQAPPVQQGAPLAGVEPGAVLRLADGRLLRLAWLRLPDVMSDLPAGDGAAATEVEAWQSRSTAALHAAFGDGAVRFRPAGPGPDRYGALPVLAYDRDGGLVQTDLLVRGLARLDLAALTDPEAAGLRAAEETARRRGIGLWSATPYRVRHVGELAGWIGTYQLAIGRIHNAARVRDKFFVNFGPEYKTDTTVLFKGGAARRFRQDVAAQRRLDGCAVLVRGWIEFWNGPLVAATEPAQVEPLEPCEREAEK